MFLPRSTRRSIADSVPGLGTAAPLTPGLWSRPFMESIVFEEGRVELRDDQKMALDELAIALGWFSTSCIIEVTGHAWGEGGDDAERRLSNQRAIAVREELIAREVPPWVLRARGYGTERPIPADSQSTSDAVRASRRVEIWLHQRTVDNPLPCSDPGADDCCRGC